jgi:hypothetical protein
VQYKGDRGQNLSCHVTVYKKTQARHVQLERDGVVEHVHLPTLTCSVAAAAAKLCSV